MKRLIAYLLTLLMICPACAEEFNPILAAFQREKTSVAALQSAVDQCLPQGISLALPEGMEVSLWEYILDGEFQDALPAAPPEMPFSLSFAGAAPEGLLMAAIIGGSEQASPVGAADWSMQLNWISDGPEGLQLASLAWYRLTEPAGVIWQAEELPMEHATALAASPLAPWLPENISAWCVTEETLILRTTLEGMVCAYAVYE